MAGVSPTDNKFVFRYQYALCEIGSQVLRKLFDSKVGPDFKYYLDTSPSSIRKRFMCLLNSGKITPPQQKLLPPSETKPKSIHFDITLLSCLLRNVCGLRRYDDAVWMNPPVASDTSVEANIVRLRELRNKVMHSTSVFMSEADLTSKWSELSNVLHDLNPYPGGIINLSSLIDKAKSMEIDEELKERHSDMVKAWHEMDISFHRGIAEVLGRLDRLVNLVEGKSQKPTQNDDILQTLKETYLREMTTTSVSPLFPSEQIDLLHIYQLPKMFVIEYHHSLQQTEYRRTLQQTEQLDDEVTTLEEIFIKNNTQCINIYITGDAGMGKTSFCKFLCLMWAKSKSDIMDPSMQKYHDYLSHFDFVFYVALCDTYRTGINAMLVDRYFFTEDHTLWHYTYSKIKDILNCKRCLVIMDGYDEWTPKIRGKIKPETPCRTLSKNSVYLTTCRPYKIENVRLLPKDLDHHVKMTGIHGRSSDVYVEKIVTYINSRSEKNRNYKDFLQEIEACDLSDVLSVPLTTTHLIGLWFRQPLTHMSKTVIYDSIIHMLLQKSGTIQTSLVQHSDSLMGLDYLAKNENSLLLQKLSMLSFNSLFKLNDSVGNLVFTQEQLLSKPYYFRSEELDTICNIGILSRNKLHGQYGEIKQKISFQHLSFLEFFASFFVTTFDTNNDFDSAINEWQTVNDILKYTNFLLFLAGFSAGKLKYVFEKTFSNISDDISTLCIWLINDFLDTFLCQSQLKSFHTLVFTCIKECKINNKENVLLKVPHLIITEDSDIVTLKQLLLYNKMHIKSVHSENGVYFDELEQLESLKHIRIDQVQTGYYDRFNQCMLKNRRTLISIYIKGNKVDKPLLPDLPITSHHKFDCLTSLYLEGINLEHKHYDTLIQYLSCNVNINNIVLISVDCADHRNDDTDCTMTLDLKKHRNLTSLELTRVNILCCTSTHSSLQSLVLSPSSKSIVSCYANIFHSIKNSNLKNLYCDGKYFLDIKTMATLASCIKSLRYIKFLMLICVKFSDMDILHPDSKNVCILFYNDRIHSTAFNSFIDSISNNKCESTVIVFDCKIILLHEKSQNKLSKEDSLDHIVECVKRNPSFNITYKGKDKYQSLEQGYKIVFYVNNP
ncbi:hypothetical protein ACF0H5_024177 [Mactra antiquata]